MKLSVFILVIFALYSTNFVCVYGLEENAEINEKPLKNHIHRTGRVGVIAFKPFGENVNVGLDVLLPFVRLPTGRKLNNNGNNEALLTVNTAAITVGGLISGIGLFIGHILKSLVTLRGREDVEDDEENNIETRSHSAEHRLDFDVEGGRFARMLEPFKFVYRNSSGARTHTSLPTLFNIIEDTFLENDIDLSACMQKSLCYLIQRTSKNMEQGVANGVEKMIDGLLQINWLMHLTHETAIEEAILTGRSNSTEKCLLKYPSCSWEAPEEQLLELLKKRVRFE